MVCDHDAVSNLVRNTSMEFIAKIHLIFLNQVLKARLLEPNDW